MYMKREIYFAGGCYWGTEHFFRLIDGVRETTVGFANGNGENPSYEEVYTDTTGFAETVRVVYEDEVVSPDFLLDCFFRSIDPFRLNGQGEDRGTRYRSGVYYTKDEDLPHIRAAFARVEARLGGKPVTECTPLKNFYPAEERHQAYLEKNPGGYCHISLRTFTYLRLVQDLRYLLGEETSLIAREANAAALIRERLGFFWIGFYNVDGEELVLGPFQGSPACQRIGFGRGVCGSAWKQDRSIVVPDVEKFPGHIACSSASRSEIVVPVHRDGKIIAVLDIDSDELSTFALSDALWLEEIVNIISKDCREGNV